MIDGGLRKIFRQKLTIGFHWQSIESPLTSGGIPDSNYCGKGIEGWVEFKKVKGWHVVMRPEQIGWAERRTRAGGRVYVAARKGPTLWLCNAGSAARLLATCGLPSLPPAAVAGCWHGGPAGWDWLQISAILIGPIRS